ncbi:MAG: OmpA family protein [Gammaproteobacteria bacterium]|nr:OmpA family protein [Gammaproteobacteria bacterium]
MRNRTATSLGMLSAFLVSALFWAMPAAAQTSAALQDSTCGGTRAGSALGCTAKEFTVNAVVQNAPGSLPTCTIGGTAEIDVIVGLQGTNTDRQDIGLFVGQSGNDPGLNNAANFCSVATFPNSFIPPITPPLSPWEDNDGDQCGDFNGNGEATPTITGVKVLCNFGTNPADPATYGKLLFPYLLTYHQNNGAVCTGPDTVIPGTTSKCNKGVGSVTGITLTGYVDIIKQTLPDGDPTLFTFTTTGTTVLSDPTDASFTLADGGTNRIETVVDVTTRTMTIVETAALGWNPTASISCVDLNGAAANTFVVTNGATRTITISLDIAHPGAVCTITNSKGVPLTLQKSWVNAITGDAVTVATTGLTTNASLPAVANAPTEIDVGSPVDVVAGNVITISEGAFTVGSAANYNASLACVGNANPLVGNVLTVSDTDQAITCTYTNSRKAATVTLRKSWSNAVVNDAATVSATGGLSPLPDLNSVAETATEIDTGPATGAFAGDVFTISELFTVGLPGNYTSSLACTGTTGLAGNVLTVGPADTAVVCTETNARAPVALTLRKTWANAIIGNAVTVSTTGGLNTATVASTADTASETDTGTPVEVFAGEVITIGEIFGTGNAGDYNTSLACTGNSVPLNTESSQLTVAVGDTAITCTVTNSRKSAQLTVRKTWASANIGDSVTVSTTGATNNANLASVAGTANETDAGTPVTVFVGEAITISEAFTVGSQSNYSSGLVCTGNNTVLAGSVLTVNALDTAITCTWTNTRAAAGLTLAKTWVNAIVGNAVTVSTTGGTNNATLSSTAGAPNETDTGSSVTVFAGEVLTISESFTTGSAANYTASLSCTGLTGGTTLVGNQLTIGATPGAIVCTETNTRDSASLALAKTWVNAIVNDAVTVSSAGGTNNATLSSTAGTPNETDTGSSVTVFAGEVLTIGESFTTGSSSNYNSALSCTGLTGGTTLVGNQLTIGATPAAIVCTETNTRRGSTLTVRKTWVNALVGNAVTVSTTGAVNNASVASVAGTPNETDASAAVNVFAGEAITITEAFTVGSASAYTSALACTGNTTPLAGTVLTVNPADTAIVCTETNTRVLFPQLTVTKTATPTTFIVGQPAAYTVTVTNTGELATSGNITLSDTLATGIGFVSATGTNWSCSGTTTLSCTFTGTLAPAASTSLTLNVTVGQNATNGNNSATASGGGDTTCPQATRCTGTVTVPIEVRGIALQIVKSANPVRVNAGSLVLYTLTITNIVNYNVVNAQVIDMPPNGLAYVPGSGTIYDSNDSNNSVSGARPITFSGVDVAIGQTIRIQYLLRAGAALAAGEYTNYATAYQFGDPISNTASTTVYAETGADPLLEQTRILGKVFDDQNGDGWQDPGERGIPGVRIASVEGLVSETDAYGRYHIEGIVLLNQERGQNFVLKLDTSTLPPGSTVTTENPHVRRITAAIPARFDFGVKLPPMPISQTGSVDMALGEIHFLPGSTEIRPEFSGILDTMAEKIRSHQSGEVFIDSASGSSPLAFERAGKVRDQLIERLTPEQRNAFVITLRLQANDGSEGSVTLSDTVKLGEVLFDTDKSVIKPEFDALLDKVAAQIEAVGGGRVSVVGHADLRGSVEYNQALGLRRANAVFKRISERLSPEARQNLSVEVEGAAVVPGAGQ